MKTVNHRVLVFDIETTPLESYTWGIYEQNVVRVKKQWRMLSFSYKWLGEKTVHFVAARHNDRGACQKLRALFNQADVVVAHNGNSFDIKKVQARFLVNGLLPSSPFKSVDTKLVARKHFGFVSNKLDDLGEILGLGRKVKHEGFDLWLLCLAGNAAAWKRMEKYNKQDVLLLEKIYLRMMPYMTAYPKTYPRAICTHCGSNDVQYRGKYPSTRDALRFICKNCGIWGHYFLKRK
tara:strand:- start:409 stop:1113 length:705 start_codon:yes stop_codon:yes gene_type:complete